MSTLKETIFTSWDFSDEELKHAVLLSPTQIQFIQTLLSQAAIDKLAESFDGKDPVKFAQREAYSRGWIDTCQYLLGLQEQYKQEKPGNPYEDPQAEPTQP